MRTGVIRLIGPGGAGKSTIGALLAERLDVAFLDLDRHFDSLRGDIGEFIIQHGYDTYARENVESYCSLCDAAPGSAVFALSSGFMTYPLDIHPAYVRVRRELERCPKAFVLLPSLDREICIAETVRRQIARPFGRSSPKEEAVIRARFDTYMTMSLRKIATMRPAGAIVDTCGLWSVAVFRIASTPRTQLRTMTGSAIEPTTWVNSDALMSSPTT
jgi:shikimate kinase